MYLGRFVGDGGDAPIDSCPQWRRTLDAIRPRFLVLGSAPTGAIPADWTTTSLAVRLILAPGGGISVFRVAGGLNPAGCPAG